VAARDICKICALIYIYKEKRKIEVNDEDLGGGMRSTPKL
jgi:hypothetical protein